MVAVTGAPPEEADERFPAVHSTAWDTAPPPDDVPETRTMRCMRTVFVALPNISKKTESVVFAGVKSPVEAM